MQTSYLSVFSTRKVKLAIYLSTPTNIADKMLTKGLINKIFMSFIITDELFKNKECLLKK